MRSISLFLIGLLLTTMVEPSLKIISFYQNQSQIIAEHCVNTDKPELKCEGHCYLEQQIVASKEQPSSNTIPEVNIFIPLAIGCNYSLELIKPFDSDIKEFFSTDFDDEVEYYGEIFTPPKIIIS